MTTNAAERPYRVLIIEDDEEVARIMSLALERDRIDCRIVPDGDAGLRTFEENQPHLVLLDLMLPGMTGQEVLEALRARSDVPVIVVSALVNGASNELLPGADAQMGKPFSPLRLLRCVREHLQARYENGRAA